MPSSEAHGPSSEPVIDEVRIEATPSKTPEALSKLLALWRSLAAGGEMPHRGQLGTFAGALRSALGVGGDLLSRAGLFAEPLARFFHNYPARRGRVGDMATMGMGLPAAGSTMVA